ncbi:MAG: chemotaxis protein CheX [bacterium]
MKAKYLNPFISAGTSVLRQFMPDIEIERGELEVVDQPSSPRTIAVYIGISGDLEGRVIYEMNKVTAVNLASAMNGEDLPGFNELVRSTIQELSNIISGNASQELETNADNKSINITPPSMIIGEETEISDSVTESFIQVPLNTNYGEILINLAVREN